MDYQDPLVPARGRFPMVAATIDYSGEPSSTARRFVLRGAEVVSPLQVRHRTPSHRTYHPEKTHRDDRVDDDSWFSPDD